jgi:hypothetical protein
MRFKRSRIELEVKLSLVLRSEENLVIPWIDINNKQLFITGSVVHSIADSVAVGVSFLALR